MSVLNQMLRDLEARGAASEPTATTTTPPPGLVLAAKQSQARDQRRRLLLWGITLSAVALAAGLWGWRGQVIDNARKVRAPLGAAQFQPALASLPAAPPTPSSALTPPAPPPQSTAEATPAVPVPAAMSTDAPPSVAAIAASSVAEKVAEKVGDKISEKTAAQTSTTARAVRTASTIPALAVAPYSSMASPPPPVPTPAVARHSAATENNPEADVARAAEMIARGRATDATALLKTIVATRPQHVTARRALAALQAEAGTREQALTTLLDGAQVDPANFAVPAVTLQAELGDTSGALATLARVPPAMRTAQQSALSAALAQRLGQHDVAIESFRTALASQNNPVWWLGLAASLEARGRRADALTAYQNALAIPTLTAELRQHAAQKAAALNTAPQASTDALATTRQP